MATTQLGVHGKNVPQLVVVEYNRESEHVPTPHLRMEEKIVLSWDLQWRQRIATHNLVQVSSCFTGDGYCH